MYRNKLNGKIAINVNFLNGIYWFDINGVRTPLEKSLFEKYYEAINE